MVVLLTRLGFIFFVLDSFLIFFFNPSVFRHDALGARYVGIPVFFLIISYYDIPASEFGLLIPFLSVKKCYPILNCLFTKPSLEDSAVDIVRVSVSIFVYEF